MSGIRDSERVESELIHSMIRSSIEKPFDVIQNLAESLVYEDIDFCRQMPRYVETEDLLTPCVERDMNTYVTERFFIEHMNFKD